MSKLLRAVSLIGVACSSLCFIALPLIAVWIPASSWIHNERLTRAMLLMFLSMALGEGYSAFRRHGRIGPGVSALGGSGLLIVVAWGGFPAPAGWLGLALLFAAWLWDWRLTRKDHQGSCGGTR